MIEIRHEGMLDVYDEARDLVEAHWREIATHKDIRLEPDIARYRAFDRLGVLRCFTARLGGTIVGYAVFIVQAHLHYAESIQALQDVIYVAPEHRRKGVGRMLSAVAEKALKEEGVQEIHQHVKKAHPELGFMLAADGYVETETIMSKRLDK